MKKFPGPLNSVCTGLGSKHGIDPAQGHPVHESRPPSLASCSSSHLPAAGVFLIREKVKGDSTSFQFRFRYALRPCRVGQDRRAWRWGTTNRCLTTSSFQLRRWLMFHGQPGGRHMGRLDRHSALFFYIKKIEISKIYVRFEIFQKYPPPGAIGVLSPKPRALM